MLSKAPCLYTTLTAAVMAPPESDALLLENTQFIAFMLDPSFATQNKAKGSTMSQQMY